MKICFKEHILKIIYKFGNMIGLFSLFDKLNSNANRVITYHGIVKDGTEQLSGMDVTQTVFEKHISFLTTYYSIKPLSESNKDKNVISITFDDGCLSDLTRAVPLLSKYGVTATFFICADVVSGILPATWNDLSLAIGFELAKRTSNNPCKKYLCNEAIKFANDFETYVRNNKVQNPYLVLNQIMSDNNLTKDILNNLRDVDADRYTPLNEVDLKKMVELGNSVCSHSSRHVILSDISHDNDILSHELLASKKYIEEVTGIEVKYLSYPFGGKIDVNQIVEDFVEKCGYSKAYYNVWTNKQGIYSSSRMTMPNTTDESHLHAVTSGFYHFMKTGTLL